LLSLLDVLLVGLLLRSLLSPLLLGLLLLRLLLSSLLFRLLLLRLLLGPLLLRLLLLGLLLGPLLLGLRSGLLVLLLCALCRLLVRLCLRALLRCGWPRGLLWPTLLLFRLLLFLFVLRERRDNRPEKQNEGGGTCCSKELHSDRLHSGRFSNMHAEHQSASAGSWATGIKASYFSIS